MSSALNIKGNHPAGLWLAHCLHQRGWQIHWTPEPSPQTLGPGAYHHRLAGYFGRSSLTFPPEWCLTRLAGVLCETETGHALNAWPVSLLDLTAIWQTLQCAPPQAALPENHLTLHLAWLPCSSCPAGQWHLTDEHQAPSGFLIQQAESWSVRLNATQSLNTAAHSRPPKASGRHPIKLCHCPPQLQQPGPREIAWYISHPSLLPESSLAQSMYWLVLQEILHGLSDGSMQPQWLYQQWENCWQKVHHGLIKMAKSQKFLPIPK